MLTRRNFLTAGAAAMTGLLSNPSQILQAVPKAETELGKVKITDVKTAVVNIKYNTTLVKVTTNSGLYGLGEAFPKVEVRGAIQELREIIIGEDPLKVEVLQQKMTDKLISRGSRKGALCGAISGIEIALWDLAGKILNVPVYVLLGGAYRTKLLVYHDSGSPKGDDPAGWVEEAQKSLAFGFKAMKFSLRRITSEDWNRYMPSPDIRKYVDILQAIRNSLGPEIPFGIDLHWKFNTRDAIRLAQAIEHLDLWFIDDPIPVENADAFARLTAASKVPIVTGENLYTRQGFRPFIEKQACDIINPDPQKCGGLLEMKKIADWADLYYMNMICHNLCTPVGTMASAHACAAIRSFVALESDSVELPYWQDFIQRDGPIYKDGYLHIPDRPGFGVELNEEACRQHLAKDSGFFE